MIKDLAPFERCVRFLLGAYAALLPLMVLHLTVAGQAVISADLVFLPLLLMALVEGVRERRRPDRLEAGLALYLGAFLLAALCSERPTLGLLVVLKVGYLVALAVVVSRLAGSEARRRALGTGWILGIGFTVVACLTGVLLHFVWPTSLAADLLLHHAGSLPVWLKPRVDGPFLSPNLLCNYLIVSAAVVSVHWRLQPVRRGWLLLGVVLAGVFTFSSGFGGLALILALTQGKGRRVLVVVAAGLALLLLVVNSVSYPAACAGRLEPSHRARCWMSATRLWMGAPLVGVGPGQVDVEVTFTSPGGRWLYLSDPHNVALSLAAQTGLLGLLAFLWLLTLVLKQAWTAPDGRALALSILCAVGYHGLTGSFEDSRHLWVALGFLWAAAGSGPDIGDG